MVAFVTALIVGFTAALGVLGLGFTAGLGVLVLAVVLPEDLVEEIFATDFLVLAFGFSCPFVALLVGTRCFFFGFSIFLGMRDSFTDSDHP